MRDLIAVIAKRLVDHPDDVVVTEEVRPDATVYRLSVHPSDVGKIIGKQGRVANALRTVVVCAAAKHHKRVLLDIES